MMGSITLKSTRNHVMPNVSPLIKSRPSILMTLQTHLQGNYRNHPQQPTSAFGIDRIDPYSNVAKHQGSQAPPWSCKSRAVSQLPHFLSVLPPMLNTWHFSPPSPLRDLVGTDFLYFVREVPEPQHTRPYYDHIKLRREIIRHLDRKHVM